MNPPVGNPDREAFGPQPLTAAGCTGAVLHVLLHPDAHILRGSLPVPPFEIGKHPFKGPGKLKLRIISLYVVIQPAAAGPVKYHITDLRGQVFPRRIRIKLKAFTKGLNCFKVPVAGAFTPDFKHAFI